MLSIAKIHNVDNACVFLSSHRGGVAVRFPISGKAWGEESRRTAPSKALKKLLWHSVVDLNFILKEKKEDLVGGPEFWPYFRQAPLISLRLEGLHTPSCELRLADSDIEEADIEALAR